MLRLPRVAVVLTSALLLATACGGGGSPKPIAQAGNNTPTGQQGNSSSSNGNNGGGGGGGGGVGGVPGAYQRGTAHVDISGGRSESSDFNSANGVTSDGNSFVNFVGDNSANTLVITSAKNQNESGVAVTVNGLTTGGQFGDKCTVDFSKNDSSELSGSFTCEGVDGVAGGNVFQGNLNIKGTFSAKS